MADLIDRKAFDFMTTAVDKTAVDLFPTKVERSTEGIHNALMVAGMTPAYGNIADLADATLYALEGEFGEAGWSAAAAIPVIGQMVSGKRALKAAKEAGEEMVTVYRGVRKWYPGKMVKNDKFVSGGSASSLRMTREGPKDMFYTTTSRNLAKDYSRKLIIEDVEAIKKGTIELKKGIVLEFEVPISHINKYSVSPGGKMMGVRGTKGITGSQVYIFEEGLPKGFLKKVHK